MNITESRHGAIRGLHGESMFKLVGIVAGEAFGAYVEPARGLRVFGAVHTERLRPGTQVLVPKGVCNGFQSVSKRPTQYLYTFDSEWVSGMAGTAVIRSTRARHRVAGEDRPRRSVGAFGEGAASRRSIGTS